MPATPNHEAFQYAERIRERLPRALQPQRNPIHPMKPILFLSLSVFSFCIEASSFAVEQRPSLLILLAADLGYQDLGCQGSPDILAQHIASLARNARGC